jgi:hypothetical protein
MTAPALLLSAVLAGADDGSAAAHPTPVQTIDLATLTPWTARSPAVEEVLVREARRVRCQQARRQGDTER